MVEGQIVASRRGAFGGGYHLFFARDAKGKLVLKRKLVMADKA